MTIDPQRVQAVFLMALQLTEPASRWELLNRECGNDAALRQRVEALLSAHSAATGFDIQPPAAALDATVDAPSVVRPGTVIAGRYKLIEAIGEGGMGSVWLAEQKEPIKRKVAIKLIKPGMDSKSVLARFDAERQALALMDHPNIAKVFDGGMTDQGRPYFVMEFVKGVPFTDYCDQARLSLNERLQLFMQVCKAVQHAHQKGIIHRDLKPSNILICLYDGKPIPKVIDFGLAKAMHHSLTDHSLHTGHGVMLGTPLYMSPEQAEHNNLDVDTRSDIYSLGVILYELLTGTTPLVKQQLKEAAYNEILRLIKEVEPPRPSTRLSGNASLPSVAAQRSIEPKQLGKLLAGDLDWIVMKALDKERSRRYETANGLSRDIERFLKDEAVEARPPGAVYRLKKLLRRNKGRVVAASLVLLALFAGTMTVLAVQASANSNLRSVNEKLDTANDELKASNTLLEQQRTRAEQREQEAIDAVKRFGDAVRDNHELKNNLSLESLRETLLQEPLAFFQSLRTRLQTEADTRAESLTRLANAAHELAHLTVEIGDKQDALRAFQESLAIRKRLFEENPRSAECQRDLATNQINIGDLLCVTGKPNEAMQFYVQARENLALLTNAHPGVAEFHGVLANCHDAIGNLYRITGKPKEALAADEQAIAILERLARENPTVTRYQIDLANSYLNIGELLVETGQEDESLSANQKALEIRKRLADENPSIALYQNNLAASLNNISHRYSARGKHAEALAAIEQSLAIRKGLVQKYPTNTEYQTNLFRSYYNIGHDFIEQHKYTEALNSFEQALAILERVAQGNPSVVAFQNYLAQTHNNIGNLLIDTGRPDEALSSYEQARTIQRQLAKENPTVADYPIRLGATLHNMAMLDMEAGRFENGRDKLLEAIECQKQSMAGNAANPTAREFLKGHYNKLIGAAYGLGDSKLVEDARRGIAEVASSDPQASALDNRMTEVLGGGPANDVMELLAFGQRSFETRRYTQAVHWHEKAFETDPTLPTYDGACAATLAGCLDGIDAPPDEPARAVLRQQAHTWLKADLTKWEAKLEGAAPEQRELIAQTLKHRQTDPDLAGVRDAKELAKLPESERAEWESLWNSVAALLAKAAGETKPEDWP